jgi:methionyl-tRNA synthetase
MRFYLAHDGILSKDTDYENCNITDRYKSALHGDLGNLASRLIRGKPWSVRDSIVWAAEGRLPEPQESDKNHQDLIRSVQGATKEMMEQLDPRMALKAVMDLIRKVSYPIHRQLK